MHGPKTSYWMVIILNWRQERKKEIMEFNMFSPGTLWWRTEMYFNGDMSHAFDDSDTRFSWEN